ncbi:MAG: FtsH protease activity modulator HflK [bacterium]|nr:FtsH protease activity modulator HflK [bacterium]
MSDRTNPDPPSVRFLTDIGDKLVRHRSRVVAAAFFIVTLVGMWQAVYTVDNGESGALLRFGGLVDSAILPGLHFLVPGGVEEVDILRTDEVFRLDVQGDLASTLSYLTGDENFIEAQIVVQYRIVDLGPFLFSVEDPEMLINQAVRAALLQSVAICSVEDVLTSAKARLQIEVRDRAQEALERLGVGVVLVAVNFASVAPPSEVAPAFRRVSDSRAEAAEIINRARAGRERSLRLARGKAEQMIQEARGASAARVAQARGETLRFEELLVQSRSARRQTRDTLKFDTLDKVLQRATVVLLPTGKGSPIEINLMGERDNRPPPTSP